MKKTIVILGLCLALLVAALGCGQGEDSDTMDMEMGVSALTALADSHITHYETFLEVLAMTQEVQSADWEEMVGILTKFEQDQFEQANVAGEVFFALPDGSYFTVDLGKTDANISDRDYFTRIMAGKRDLGDLVVGKTTHKKLLIAGVPVMKEGEIIGLLAAGIYLEDLSNTISNELELSDDMVFYAVDESGEVALHSETELIFTENPGLLKNTVFKTSPLTGWRFALGFKE